jgi:hypothetical protein
MKKTVKRNFRNKKNKMRRGGERKTRKLKRHFGGGRFTPKTYAELKKVVDKYNENDWQGKYGEIGTWNVSNITDMHELFTPLKI